MWFLYKNNNGVLFSLCGSTFIVSSLGNNPTHHTSQNSSIARLLAFFHQQNKKQKNNLQKNKIPTIILSHSI